MKPNCNYYLKKGIWTLVCLALFVIPRTILSQNFSEGYLYVYISDPSTLPIGQIPERSSNADLNQAFIEFDVQTYYQSFPGAKTAGLSDVYEIHFNGSLDSLEQRLNTLGLYDNIEKADYYTINTCTSPSPPVNDTWIANNFANNYALELIEANCAWSITTGDPNIVVGVIDTEFETNHEDLQNQIDGVFGSAPAYCTHGTYVSGLVAAETNNNKGIASIGYNTKVAGYIVPHSTSCTGNPWNALWQAYLAGRRIINVSWSGTGSGTTAALVTEMTQNGLVLVVAAGNSPGSTSHSLIADIPGVINVSGVDASNSNGPTGHARNQWVDLCAPSINVTTTYTGSTYGGCWGTSCAAPIVAGTAALILAVNPCLTSADVEDILTSTTDPIADEADFPGLLGTGRLNAYNAVLLASTYSQTTVIRSGTNITWTTPHDLQCNLLIESGATLSIENEVLVNGGVNVTIENGGVLNIRNGGLFHFDPFTDLFSSGIVTVGNNSKLEVHESSTVTVRNGSKLILEQGAELSVHNTGLVKIEPGATLEYDNAAITLGGPEAVLEIGGVLDIADNATFTFQGGNLQNRPYSLILAT